MIKKFLLSFFYGLLILIVYIVIVGLIIWILDINEIEVTERLAIILLILGVVVFLWKFKSYYSNYKEKEQILKVNFPEKEKESTKCTHCNGKGLCNCDACIKRGDEYKVGFFSSEKIRREGLKNYSDSKYYYKCSVCKGSGYIIANNKTIIKSDSDDIESMNKLQEQTSQKLDKELELLKVKEELEAKEYERKNKILEQELKLAEMNLKIQKERKNVFGNFLEQIKSKFVS